MKKLMLSIVVFMAVAFNVQADTLSSIIGGKISVPFIALPVSLMIAASKVEYKACNDLPYVKVKAENGNYYYDSIQCK